MITISPGHWANTGSGANGILNEVNEARKVVNEIVQILRREGIKTNHVEDNSSNNQRDNINYIVSKHNASDRKLDVSVHFNASAGTHSKGIGTEVLYYDQKALADKMSASIASVSGLINRGGKKRTDLGFLASTNKPAVLIEICFVNSSVDAAIYRRDFNKICNAIAKDLAAHVGKSVGGITPSVPKGVNVQVLPDEQGATKWRVISGAYSSKAAAIAAAEKSGFAYAEIKGTVK